MRAAKGTRLRGGGRSGLATAHLLASIIRPLVIGEDPLNRELIWQKIRQMDRWWGFLPIYAHGPVDVALWDLAAKAAGLPLYKYLGGYRTELPAYASSLILDSPKAFAAQAQEYREKGYRAYKLHPWGQPDRDVDACAAVRKAVGGELVLMSFPARQNFQRSAFS